MTKTIRLNGDRLRPELAIEVEVHHRGDAPIETRLGIELSLHLLGGGGNPSAWYDVRGERSAHDGTGTAEGIDAIGYGNDWVGVAVAATMTPRRGRLVEPDRDRVQLGVGLRARLPGLGAAALVAGHDRRPASRAGSPSARSSPSPATAPPRRPARPRDRYPQAMTRGRLVVHAHFYQPFRVDPFTGHIPDDRSAAPFRNWNERITAECYRPIAELGIPARDLVEPRARR